MENNNDNNLFTNMFGMESEEQPVSEPIPEPTPVLEEQKIEETISVQPTIQPSITIPKLPVEEEIIVLDSNPIPQPENQPVVEEQQLSLSTINSNITSMPKEEKFDVDNYTSKDSSYKTVCIILGITLLIVLAAFPLYSVVNNYLNNNKNDNSTENKQTIPQEYKSNEKEEKPSTPVLNINFDIDATFDKGYTTNQNELNQTQGYQPEVSEGVIKCETINNIQSQTERAEVEYYFYYKDYMTKKFLAIQKYKFVNLSTYNSNLQALQSLRSIMAQNEHMYTKLLTDTNSYRLDFYMLQDLAYSQAVKVPDSAYYYDSTISYNKPIKSTMNQFLGDQIYVGNMYCSTIVTQDASL